MARRDRHGDQSDSDSDEGEEKGFFFKNICCCFNPDLFCGWYTPRPFLMVIIVTLSIIECLGWLIFVSLLFLIQPTSVDRSMFGFFSFFNPFIREAKCLEGQTPQECAIYDSLTHKMNQNIIQTFLILSVPQIVLMYYKAYKGLDAWSKRFEIKSTERYYRWQFTYYTYTAFIKLIIFL